MTRTIDFHFDILSPFAHVALARIGELPTDVTVVPKPVLLGAVLSHWGVRGPAEIDPKRLPTYRMSVFLAEKYGVAMRFPPRHPFNPLAALRILAGADADLDMTRRAFGFVFGDARAPDDEAGLAAFAEAVDAPVSLAADEGAKAKLRALTEEAIGRGVFGVPTFAAPTENGHELFWGVDAFDMLKAWLADGTMFSREPYAHLDGIEVGIRRK